jgi:transcriptional regulator with XRE-family HTH domain
MGSNIDFGRRLRQIRAEKEMSQVLLAKRAGVSRQIIQAYEKRGGHSPTLVMLIRLADALNVSVTQLLGDQGGGLDKGSGGTDNSTLVAIKLFRGVPGGMMERPGETIKVPAEVEIAVDSHRVAAMEVDTDEMYPTLHKGDIVLFDYGTRSPRSRDVVIGHYAGSPFCRRWSVRDRKNYLEPDNPLYQEIEVANKKNLTIIGTVRMIIQRKI